MSVERDTERVHPLADRLDGVSMAVWLEAMHADNACVLSAVRAAMPEIVELAQRAAQALAAGRRVILAGAGTSGRLAALEAAECPPTFGTTPEQIVALVAGGTPALQRAIEGAEDDVDAGARELALLNVEHGDVVIGVSASGSTPYVQGVLAEARRRGAQTAVIVCNRVAPLAAAADTVITLLTGSEFVAGSTRLKAASAQKMALNLLTTGALRQLGRVRRGRMVALRATNAKLSERAIQIVSDLAGVSLAEAAQLLDSDDGDVARVLPTLPAAPHQAISLPLEIALRALTAGDAAALAMLAEQPSVRAATAPFANLGGEAFFHAWLSRPGLALGAWHDVELVGVILVERRDATWRAHVADVSFVAVSDAARGQAVGDRLIEAALAWARAALLSRIELRVWPANIGALRLYERHGFQLEGRLRAHACVQGRFVDALLMAWVAPETETFDNWT